MSSGADGEVVCFWLALLLYLLAGVLAMVAALLNKQPVRVVGGLALAGLLAHTLSLGLRWQRLEHGPFGTQFEILSSNVWSMMVAFMLSYWLLPALRPLAALLLPFFFMMMGWMVLANPGDANLPATYNTLWLYIHIGFGKVFMGLLLLATGMASVVLLRGGASGTRRFASLPDNGSLDELTYRFLAIGLIFHALMLVSGAIWAQAAWGRYWSWDPLETWSLITWLLLAITLHVRPLFAPPHRLTACLTWAIFVVAFLTFFGVPFISRAPHQGVV
ncbi:MAG: cytochrome c biogenesis protein CcsA [Magnetococcales bacterium]|nr:cytochrome c biogenesis protein CcsA [Magnetococcales bacterium]